MLWAAIVTGLIGSLHCTGMCGPLICVMPINKTKPSSEITGLLLYNIGRIISYALLGLVVGSFGALISKVIGVWFAYTAAIFLIIFGISRFFKSKNREIRMPLIVKKWMGKLFRMRSPYTLPLLGMLNGIIPCGIVYTALAGATALANPLYSALYMLLFGIGTWPAIFSSYYLTGKTVKFLKGYYRQATSVFLIVMGLLLFYRAYNNMHQVENTSNKMSVCD